MVKSAIGPSLLDGVFHALSDPTRRAILRDIAEEEKTVGPDRPPLPVLAGGNLQAHSCAGRIGLVTRRKQGSFQFVKINPLPMQHAQQWLSHYEKFWSERLDEFQHYFKDKKQKKETRQ